MKHKNKLFRNPGLKILSFLFAVILWLLVTNISDPVVPVQFRNVQVRLSNTNLITERGEVYSVLEDTDVIPVVTVTAPRSVVDSLEQDNIVATADVADLTSVDTVGIELSTNKYNNEIVSISGSIDAVRLNIEAKKTKAIALKVTTVGEVDDGYILGEAAAEQNQVRISGPESVVDSVSSAVAEVGVAGFTSSISTNADIRLYDAEGNQVDTAGLTMNMTSVRVNVDIWPVREVPVVWQTTGTPANGYMATGEILSEPSSVKIAGRSAVLNKVEAIEIPAEALDLTGAEESVTKTVDLRQYLPSGVMLADQNFTGSVAATAVVEALEETTVEIAPGDIALTNVPDGYTVRIVGEVDEETGEESEAAPLRIRFRGLRDELEGLQNAAAVSPRVDVGALLSAVTAADKSGLYTTTVALTVPEHVRAVGGLSVRVRVESESAAAGESGTTASTAAAE